MRHIKRKKESTDLYAIRVIADSLPSMSKREIIALIDWMESKCYSEIASRTKATDSHSDTGDDE